MLDPERLFDGMMIFYLIIAIAALTIAIMAYPTIRERSQKS